jgi:RNA polymerase sigma-70 factor (ECF subfamily)
MNSKAIKQFILGDEKAFELLYLEYYKLVFAICYSRLLDYSKTISICQDIFIKIYNSRETFKEGNIKYWVLSIARNTTTDFIKDEIKRRTAEENYVLNNEDNIEAQKSGEEILELAKNILDEKSYEIIIMHFCDQVKYKDIAIFYNQTTSTITNIASRALKKLKKEYENEKNT